MTDNQYNIALTVFFISYSIFEPLSNMLLKRLQPRIFIPTMYVPIFLIVSSVSSGPYFP